MIKVYDGIETNIIKPVRRHEIVSFSRRRRLTIFRTTNVDDGSFVIKIAIDFKQASRSQTRKRTRKTNDADVQFVPKTKVSLFERRRVRL